jgi:hypothetical protein
LNEAKGMGISMIKDEVLALCELSNDLLYHKIPKAKLSYYIEEALKLGKIAAEYYQGQEIRELYKENQIEVEYIKASTKTYGVSFRAQVEMDKKHTKVMIYEGSIGELSKNSGFEGRKPLTYEKALEIHLCHEFFHYLEYTKDEFVSDKLDTIETMRLPFYTKKVHINRCSEIAAHAFTKQFLKLEELPNLYDYYYLINSGKMKKSSFDEMLQSYEQLLSKA